MPRKKPEKPSQVQLPDGTLVAQGTLVSYYRNGWRAGHVVEIISAHSVKIQPIVQTVRRVTVPVEDLRKTT
jgi:hypothetical protein